MGPDLREPDLTEPERIWLAIRLAECLHRRYSGNFAVGDRLNSTTLAYVDLEGCDMLDWINGALYDD